MLVLFQYSVKDQAYSEEILCPKDFLLKNTEMIPRWYFPCYGLFKLSLFHSSVIDRPWESAALFSWEHALSFQAWVCQFLLRLHNWPLENKGSMADILAQTLKSVFCLLGQSYEEWSVPLVKARKAALSFLASLSDYFSHSLFASPGRGSSRHYSHKENNFLPIICL